ncbi:hypothetical protein BGX24_012675 [Mortierella sp. AD032]|nr:hypothetical protein BGX24_012675 [Mortierella sp. AD032]
MESIERQQENLNQDILPQGLIASLESLRIDSPVSLDQLTRFFENFDDIWEEYISNSIPVTTAPAVDNGDWPGTFHESSTDDPDIRKQHAIYTLEPRLVDCSESLMSSRLSEARYAVEWRMSSEIYGDATRALTTLQDRWEELSVGGVSGTDAGDVVMTLSCITRVNKVLRLLDRMRDKDLAREVPQLPPQQLDISLDLHPPAKLELELSLQLDVDQGLEQSSDRVLSQATMALSKMSTFDNAHGDDSLYDPNEWFVSPEEVPVPRDLILDDKPKPRHRASSAIDTSTDLVEMMSTGNPDQESTASALYSSSVQLPAPLNTVAQSGKITPEGQLANWLEILREQQEQGRRQMQEQIEMLQQQLQIVHLQYDQQHHRLTSLEEKQEPQQQEQEQLGGQLEGWVKQNEQAEWERQEHMEDMQEQLLWQQEQLSNRGELRQEGLWVQRSDFERLELQFERLQKHHKQQLQEGVGVKHGDFKRLELQFDRLQREQRRPLPPPNNGNGQQQHQKSSQSPDQKKIQQLYSDHQHLETKYRQLKQEFDRQAEKQRRHWERQQQIEQQLVKHQGIIQGQKLQVRQLHADQKSQTTQHLRRIDVLEEQLAQLQESYDSLAASSQSQPKSASVLADVKPPLKEQPVLLSEQSPKKQKVTTTSTPQHPTTRSKSRRTARTALRRQDDSPSVSRSTSRDTASEDENVAGSSTSIKEPDTTESDQECSDDHGDNDDSHDHEDESEAVSETELDGEAETKNEMDFQSTITNDARLVPKSRRRSGGDQASEVSEVSAVSDTFRDDRNDVRRSRGRELKMKKDETTVQVPPPKRGRGRPRLTNEQRKATIDTRMMLRMKTKKESEQQEVGSDEEEEEEDEEEKEKEEEQQVPVRRLAPSKALRSGHNIATALTSRTIKIGTPQKQGMETRTNSPPRARRPLLPRVSTRSSSASNVSNSHITNTATSTFAGIIKTDSKVVVMTTSTNDNDEQSKENPRKRSAPAPVPPATISKRRLRSLRSSGLMDVATRTRSSGGTVKTYHEILGPNAPKSLRI